MLPSVCSQTGVVFKLGRNWESQYFEAILPEPKNPHCPLIRRIVKSKLGKHFNVGIGI